MTGTARCPTEHCPQTLQPQGQKDDRSKGGLWAKVYLKWGRAAPRAFTKKIWYHPRFWSKNGDRRKNIEFFKLCVCIANKFAIFCIIK